MKDGVMSLVKWKSETASSIVAKSNFLDVIENLFKNP